VTDGIARARAFAEAWQEFLPESVRDRFRTELVALLIADEAEVAQQVASEVALATMERLGQLAGVDGD
jgi:hypothetical protein